MLIPDSITLGVNFRFHKVFLRIIGFGKRININSPETLFSFYHTNIRKCSMGIEVNGQRKLLASIRHYRR
jgi:hypothetical protein